MIPVLVCGGRAFDDYAKIEDTLDWVNQEVGISVLIHGDSGKGHTFPNIIGADRLAGHWAKQNGVPVKPYPVEKDEWEQLGKSAGPRRNRQMLVEGKPKLVVAFRGGKGTANMVKQAKAVGVEVIEVG